MMPPDTLPLALDETLDAAPRVVLGPRAIVLRGFALGRAPALVAAIGGIAVVWPFRHMVVPGGWKMSVALTNCGDAGWVTDRSGYRYDAIDPETGRRWPAIPQALTELAAEAAAAAAF